MGKKPNSLLEMINLNIGDGVGKECNGLHLNVMLRKERVEVGEELSDKCS